MRPRFFSLQNATRRTLQAKYFAVKGWYDRQQKIKKWSKELPRHLWNRLDSLVARDIATVIWHTQSPIPMTEPVLRELQYLSDYLAQPTNQWSISIGHLIPRDPTFASEGDASHLAGGALSPSLWFWFAVNWSADIRRRVKLNSRNPDYIHINCLEFLVVVLQLAAAITRLEDQPWASLPPALHAQFPTGFPHIPTLLTWTDNTPSKKWANKVTTASPRGQYLVQVYAELLRRCNIGTNCDWIEGESNVNADKISRPVPTLPDSHHCQQIFRTIPESTSWNYFRPAPDLLSLLASRLSCTAWPDHPVLPKRLGRFEAAGSIISSFATV